MTIHLVFSHVFLFFFNSLLVLYIFFSLSLYLFLFFIFLLRVANSGSLQSTRYSPAKRIVCHRRTSRPSSHGLYTYSTLHFGAFIYMCVLYTDAKEREKRKERRNRVRDDSKWKTNNRLPFTKKRSERCIDILDISYSREVYTLLYIWLSIVEAQVVSHILYVGLRVFL